jgi:Domain of unknown function (DUF6429)
MTYDEDKVDEMVLALLYLTLHENGRAWKGHDWDAMDRLHKKGMILDPVGKARGAARSFSRSTFALALNRSRRTSRLFAERPSSPPASTARNLE